MPDNYWTRSGDPGGRFDVLSCPVLAGHRVQAPGLRISSGDKQQGVSDTGRHRARDLWALSAAVQASVAAGGEHRWRMHEEAFGAASLFHR